MAAITPHLGEEELLGPEDAAYQECGAGVARALTGLGQTTTEKELGCPAPGQVVAVNHAPLVDLAWSRSILQDVLGGREMGLDLRGRDYYLTLSPALEPESLPWSPLSRPLQELKLLSWTSKMGAPSFSLPAGHGSIGGACPGAGAGQSTTPEGVQRNQGKVVLRVLTDYRPQGAPAPERIDLAAAICAHCYATTGNYLYSDNAARALLRWAWVDQALRQPATSGPWSSRFVEVMVDAIDQADYDGDGSCEPRHWAMTGWRFFRIHDAGDFYSEPYYRAWVEVCEAFVENNPHGHAPVMFWAPTRMWAMGDKWIRLVAETGSPNLVVRPSGYEINQHAPELPGRWAAPSTVYAPAVADAGEAGLVPVYYDWDCQAYAVAKGPSCRGAESPVVDPETGENYVGCRACWMRPDLTINYRAH